MSLAIETEGLTKLFEPTVGWTFWRRQEKAVAVKDVSLKIERGSVFGLLGRNGAGKTTLTKMLCTLLVPSSGSAQIAGISLANGEAIRQKVGLVITDERSFYWRLSGRRNLEFFAALHGFFGADAKQRVAQLLTLVELTDAADNRVNIYSAGMRQRLAIARALLHRPEILFLDEPSRSLDPSATNRLHALIRHLIAQQELTVFLISHDLNEIAALSDQICFMRQGQIVAAGSLQSLQQAHAAADGMPPPTLEELFAKLAD